jgi:polygalacturonase
MSSLTDSRRKFVQGAGAALAISAVSTNAGARPPTHGAAPAGSSHSFNVMSYGAEGDGKTIDSPAINKAIEAASAAGGGIVFFPPGTYLCYSIRLKSSISIVLSNGTSIVAADSPTQPGSPGYDLAESIGPWEAFQDYGHSHHHNSLIWGEGLENVAIYGPGLIFGKGLSDGRDKAPRAEQPGVGNKAIALKNCRDVLLRDFSILLGGHFGIFALGVDNLTIDNLKIDTNRDGMDIDCCRNVRVSNCSVNSPWDDAICLKSSFALGYARATQWVTITNCFVSGKFAEGALLDGTLRGPPPERAARKDFGIASIKFGTESNGGFKNITVSNCVFEGCRGIIILTVDGGVIEDVSFSNITMHDTVYSPIFLRLGSRMRGPEGVPVGAIRRINISNIVSSSSTSRYASMIVGLPNHLIEDVKISNVLIRHSGGGTQQDAALRPVENEKGYPDPMMFGTTPAHGLLVRHAAGVEIKDFKVTSVEPDARPVFWLDDVQHTDFFDIKTNQKPGAAIFTLSDVKDIDIARCKPLADVHIAEAAHQEI